ncbi:unnamed protein product [Sphagnum troendelagicum]|uniref:Uncharacterized protein n=1 Tax=Sphagnum troendelagicum TaxID=128251 RepID=A0ABP0TFN2_9BRYO
MDASWDASAPAGALLFRTRAEMFTSYPCFAFYSISVGPTSSAAASDRYHRQKTEDSSFQKMGNLLQLDSSQFH